MLKWLKKFVLDILPSVAATIIGAYVVNHYIIPKSSAGQNQPSIASAISDAITSKMSDATIDKASFEKGVAEKTAIEKTAEKVAADRAAAADKAGETSSDTAATEPRKQHPAPKPGAKTAAKSVDPAPAPAQDERRAGDLARAVLERLRGISSDSTKPDPAKVEAVKAPETPRIQPVSTVASAPPMQPLPPAITVARPNPDVFEQGNAVPVMRQPYPQAASRSDELRRFAPPADIPASRPMDLRAEATAPLSDRTSVTDEVLSAAKSMFHAVIPR